MNKKSAFQLIGVFSMAVLLSAQASYAADVKIGTVDMQKAMQTVESGKKAKAHLEKEFNTMREKLEKEKVSINEAAKELSKQSAVMSQTALAKKQAELQERAQKLQESTGRSQSEISQKERELIQPIFIKLRSIIAEMAQKKGYTIVLEKNENSVLYSPEKDDLTSEVISAYDKAVKSKD